MTTPRIEEMVDKLIKANGIVLLAEYTKGDVIGLQSIRTELENALTQAHQAGIDEAVEMFAQFIEDIPEAYGWGKEDDEADRGYQICSKNVKAMGRKVIKALQDKK